MTFKTMETTQKKKPSYLQTVKGELLTNIVADFHLSPEEAESLWQFMSGKIAQSYWNGVEAGSSGRVQPKAGREAKKFTKQARG